MGTLRVDFLTVLQAVPVLALGIALLCSVVAVLALVPVGRSSGWVDRPSVRKAHEGEIPLIGGWAVLLGLLAAQWVTGREGTAPAGYWTGLLLLFTIALIDDRTPIRARYRFVAQITAAIAGVSLGGHFLSHLGDLFGSGDLDAAWIVIPVSIFGIVAVINAVNFSDGADGLCGGLAFISLFFLLAAATLSAQAAGALGATPAPHAGSLVPLAAGMMGAIAGFLVFNLRTPWRKRAAVFLGDSGSMAIGFTLAWLSVHVTTAYGAASVSPVVCLWIMAVPLADSASCFVRRVLAGDTPMTPDLKHLHHLIRRSGLSIGQAVFAIHLGGFACGAFGVAGWWLGMSDRTLFFTFVVAISAFTLITNLAWRRIDARDATEAITA